MVEKLAVITGGSSGIGLAMARILGRQGYNVVLIARGEDRLKQAVQSLNREYVNAMYIVADVTKAEDLKKAKEKILKISQKIDFLILSAGIVTVKLLEEYSTVEELRSDIDVDLMGVVQSAYYFSQLLGRGSRVLLISSALGMFGMAGYTTYSAAKAGVLNFGDAWRRELLPRGIYLYVATPADVDTPQLRGEIASQPEWMRTQSGPRKAQSAEKIASRILRKCRGRYRFLIVPTFDVGFLLFVNKFLPMPLRNFLIDRVFPLPPMDAFNMSDSI